MLFEISVSHAVGSASRSECVIQSDDANLYRSGYVDMYLVLVVGESVTRELLFRLSHQPLFHDPVFLRATDIQYPSKAILFLV